MRTHALALSLLFATTAVAQTPAPDPLAEATAGLKSTTWPEAFRRLRCLAAERQQEVLEAIAPLLRPGGDAEVTARASILVETIAAAHAAREKRDELRQRFRKLSDSVADVKQAANEKSLADLQQRLQSLRESIDADAPLHPTPLRVPVTGKGDVPAAPPAGPSGYREIDVGGKKMLVPADALPEGTEYTAEMTGAGLVVKRKGAPKPDGKGKEPPKPAGEGKSEEPVPQPTGGDGKGKGGA